MIKASIAKYNVWYACIYSRILDATIPGFTGKRAPLIIQTGAWVHRGATICGFPRHLHPHPSQSPPPYPPPGTLIFQSAALVWNAHCALFNAHCALFNAHCVHCTVCEPCASPWLNHRWLPSPPPAFAPFLQIVFVSIPNISSNQFWQCQDFGTIWSPIPSLFTATNDFGLVFVVVGMHWKTAKNNKSIAAPIGCLRYGSHISWTNMEVFSWNKKNSRCYQGMPMCAFQGHCFLILISL